jgi:hypothetical protein
MSRGGTLAQADIGLSAGFLASLCANGDADKHFPGLINVPGQRT